MRLRLTLTVALLLTAGCTAAPASDHPLAPATSPSATVRTPTGLQVEAQRHRIAERIMQRRERAVRDKDERAFLSTLDVSNTAMVRRQKRLFANLVAMPLRTFTLHATDATWPSGFAQDRFRATAYIPYVQQRLQLRGFDPVPVTTTYGLTLAPVHGHWKIVSDDDVRAREAEGARDAPWDLTRISVHRTAHALGFFDRGSEREATSLMQWTEQSVRRVRAEVPLRWPGRVVVYALSDPQVLRALGERMQSRAAVAFPVLDDNEHPTRRVATRVVINPRYLPRSELEGTYLLSHEITHVALAGTAYGTPAWVQEGLAEYVATRGGSPSLWYVGPSTAARARRGVDAMPSSTFFGDQDPAYDYNLSLAAFVSLTDRFGEPKVWSFLKALSRTGSPAHPEGEPDRVLRRMFHLDSARLAGRAADVLVARG
ncbi:MAG: hypothetical protein HOQ22_07180 [Nocardioidaceae bacterium]|nr:hypothetical protein [Nocardioidaceae bacterium]NUS50808.1 hypothetical protein [Nocardioidaceae bacterium]